MPSTNFSFPVLALVTLLTVAPMPVQASELYSAINERLSLMQDVAAHKWLNEMPIEALDREALVIEKAVLSGLEQGITVAGSRRFFVAQIEAAKEIQRCWFKRWQKLPPPEGAPDLIAVTRPRLLELGDNINQLLAKQEHDEDQFRAEIKTDCLSETFLEDIATALSQIQIYPDRLTQITDSGLLRVGTTGDYSPFSFARDNEELSGIDIELARSLAIHMDVELMFVPTSWPTLMEDLAQGKYDIAMSGVSRIPAREKQAYFSHAYHVGGKTPISRCTDAERLSSLKAINQPEVRIIVNPGGTNERFLDANINRARKVLHQDNRTIFDQLVLGVADVMITDLIEAQLQSRHYQELCMTMPGQTLSYQDKGYMMPKDPGLLAEVNQWLKETEDSGRLSEIFNSHLESH